MEAILALRYHISAFRRAIDQFKAVDFIVGWYDFRALTTAQLEQISHLDAIYQMLTTRLAYMLGSTSVVLMGRSCPGRSLQRNPFRFISKLEHI